MVTNQWDKMSFIVYYIWVMLENKYQYETE